LRRNRTINRKDPEITLERALGPSFAAYRKDFALAESFKPFPFPLHLDVDVTTKCDLGCPMCPTGARAGNLFPGLGQGLALPFGLYARALSECAYHGLPSLRLGMSGEPLLVQGIDRWVSLARDLNVTDVQLVTNGQRLARKTSQRLIGAGLTRLMVSVDAGSPEAYARARPGGDFLRLLRNIEGFLEERERLGSLTPVLRLSFVDTGDGGELDAFLALFGDMADYVAIQSYAPLVPGHALGLDGAAERLTPKGGRCAEPWARLAIHANGGLFPCCSDHGRHWPLGFFPAVTLKGAWDSRMRRAVAGMIPGCLAHPACLRCAGGTKGEAVPDGPRRAGASMGG
jgi:hypothetical protein